LSYAPDKQTKKLEIKSNAYPQALQYRQNLLPITTKDKKDGYRQQNVRQPQN